MNKGIAWLMAAALVLSGGCGQQDSNDEKNTAAAEDAASSWAEETQEISKEYISFADNIGKSNKPRISDDEFEGILSDIAFIGDSVTSGFGGYQKVPVSEVFATQCVGPSNIYDYTFEYGDSDYAALTILSYQQPANVVISMGLNDINTYSPEDFSELYMEFVDDAMTACPDSQFYIFSVTPVSAECENISNDTIDKVNEQLKKTINDTGSKRLHYVDVNSVLKDSAGNMDSGYSGGDGIHLNSGAYDVMLERLKSAIE